MAVGYNPFPGIAADPFALALSKGYSQDPEGWDIGLALQRAHAANDNALDDAHLSRYGVGWTTAGPLGAESEITLWPRVLKILGEHGELGLHAGLVSLREAHDATFRGTTFMIQRAFSLDGVTGYDASNPIVVNDPTKPAGAFFERTHLLGGVVLFYRNDFAPPSTPPTPPPPPPPEPPIVPPDPKPVLVIPASVMGTLREAPGMVAVPRGKNAPAAKAWKARLQVAADWAESVNGKPVAP